ncbi:MAG: glucosaminidase domain-containing protein [Alphaproteobacteria bacterium]|nr:glucosaminidase domain-containing protein [Alphaproteobacteria bacterium]
MKFRFFIVLFLINIFYSPAGFAKPQFELDLKPEGVYIDNVNVAVLKQIFQDYGYVDFMHDNLVVPPLFLESMPQDFSSIKSKDERNKLFIMIMAPLVLRVNEELILEAGELDGLRQSFETKDGLSSAQNKRLEELAQKYDVFTRMQGVDRQAILLEELKIKIDAIPPAILIAAAVAESNWGTAMEVKQGNALYKLKDWYTDKGIKPANEDDDSYRIRIYPDLLAAVRDYALKINTDLNFEHFRLARVKLRIHSKFLKGRMSAYNMVLGSPLENYAGLLTYILTFYDMVYIDAAKLDKPRLPE